MSETLIMLVISALVGALLVPAMAGLKKASAWVDGLPAWAQRSIVLLLSAGATWASSALGFVVPTDILHAPGDVVQTLLQAVLAFLAHKVWKMKSA